MVEIKGDNKFYRDDIETGKFDDKCFAAKKYAEEHDMKYVVLFEKDIDSFIHNLSNNIKNNSLTSPTICPLF